MYKPSRPSAKSGYTLETIHLCKERVHHRFALEEALAEARIRDAHIYQGPIPKWVEPVRGDLKSFYKRFAKKKNKVEGGSIKTSHSQATTASINDNRIHNHNHNHNHYDNDNDKDNYDDVFNLDDVFDYDEDEENPPKKVEEEDSKPNNFTKPPLQLQAPPLTVERKERVPKPSQSDSSLISQPSKEKSKKNKANKAHKSQEYFIELIEEDLGEELEEEPVIEKPKKPKVIKKKPKPKNLDKWEKDLLNELTGSCADKLETWLLVKYSMSDKSKRTQSEKLINSQNSDSKSKKKKQKTGSMSAPDDKKSKNRSNEEQRTFVCTCSACGGPNSPCPGEELEAIDEEQELECGETQVSNSCGACNSCPQCNPPEEDPCSEFFDVIRDSMEDAVKKSLEEVFSKYFCSCMEKIQCLAAQIDHNECIMSKVFTDLNDKISYYGERNAQQFQYLCVRMEHDRLFYQQQQEYFLKQTAPQKPPCVDDAQESLCRCNKPSLTDEEKEKHKKGRYWDCTLDTDNDDQHAIDINMEDDDDDDQRGLRGSKSRIGKPPGVKPIGNGSKPEPPGKPMKKK